MVAVLLTLPLLIPGPQRKTFPRVALLPPNSSGSAAAPVCTDAGGGRAREASSVAGEVVRSVLSAVTETETPASVVVVLPLPLSTGIKAGTAIKPLELKYAVDRNQTYIERPVEVMGRGAQPEPPPAMYSRLGDDADAPSKAERKSRFGCAA